MNSEISLTFYCYQLYCTSVVTTYGQQLLKQYHTPLTRKCVFLSEWDELGCIDAFCSTWLMSSPWQQQSSWLQSYPPALLLEISYSEHVLMKDKRISPRWVAYDVCTYQSHASSQYLPKHAQISATSPPILERLL